MTFKNLAKRAKSRLSAAASTSDKTVSVALGAKSTYYISASSIDKIEDDPLFNKIKRMLEVNKDIINPIGKLIDHSVFDNLTPTEKDRYLLDLSSRFKRAKRKIMESQVES